MPAPTKIYFAQLSSVWGDWVEVVNVSQETASVTALARDEQGQAVWSQELNLTPFQAWVIPADMVKVQASLVVSSNKSIVGERLCHSKTYLLDFPGASVEGMNIGKRLFFPEIYSGGVDWFRILNVGEKQANVNVILRQTNGQIYNQVSRKINPLTWWQFTDENVGNITGTLEVMSTQPVLGERHLVYEQGHIGSSLGQLAQVLDKPCTKLYFPELSEFWNDWVRIVNVSSEKAKVTAVARNQKGEAVWSEDAEIDSFRTWNPNVEEIKGNTSVTVTSDKHIVGERHDHRGVQILSFPGAALELRTVGRRLFFTEIYSGGLDWFRFLNVGENPSRASVIARDREGNVKSQVNSPDIPSMGYWIVTDKEIGNITGTLEALCTQLTVGERHLHWSRENKEVAIGQFGQVLD